MSFDRKVGKAGHTHQGTVGTIAALSYMPAADVNLPVTSTASVDVDATNVLVSFVTPDSGMVVITASIAFDIGAPAGFYLSLREGASDLANTMSVCGYLADATTNPSIRGTATREWVITGLVPGSAHTYKLGCAFLSAAGTVGLHYGPSWGPVTMTVRT